MEVVSESEASCRPAGRAREDPNENPHLDPPNRPASSFLWFTSPWKTFKFIIWKRFKWVFIGGLIFIFLGLFVALFLYSLPEIVNRKIFNV